MKKKKDESVLAIGQYHRTLRRITGIDTRKRQRESILPPGSYLRRKDGWIGQGDDALEENWRNWVLKTPSNIHGEGVLILKPAKTKNVRWTRSETDGNHWLHSHTCGFPTTYSYLRIALYKRNRTILTGYRAQIRHLERFTRNCVDLDLRLETYKGRERSSALGDLRVHHII